MRFAKVLPDDSAYALPSALRGRVARAREILGMTHEGFGLAFKGSRMKRAKPRGLKRNATVVLGTAGTADDADMLERAPADEEPLVRHQVVWTLHRLAKRDAASR